MHDLAYEYLGPQKEGRFLWSLARALVVEFEENSG